MLPLVVLLARPAPSAQASDDGADHAEHPHRVVRITQGKLSPRTLRLRADEAVVWVNYTTTKTAHVYFEREVAKHIVCTSPAAFRLTDTRLESSALHAHQAASLCQLAPGEYRYAVELRGITTPRNVPKPLEGVIIVEDAGAEPESG